MPPGSRTRTSAPSAAWCTCSAPGQASVSRVRTTCPRYDSALPSWQRPADCSRRSHVRSGRALGTLLPVTDGGVRPGPLGRCLRRYGATHDPAVARHADRRPRGRRAPGRRMLAEHGRGGGRPVAGHWSSQRRRARGPVAVASSTPQPQRRRPGASNEWSLRRPQPPLAVTHRCGALSRRLAQRSRMQIRECFLAPDPSPARMPTDLLSADRSQDVCARCSGCRRRGAGHSQQGVRRRPATGRLAGRVGGAGGRSRSDRRSRYNAVADRYVSATGGPALRSPVRSPRASRRRCGTNDGWLSRPILLLSTSDTDLISARSSGKNYRWANPSRLSDEELPDLLADASIVVVRILGGYRAWQNGIDAVIASGVPTVLVSGEQAADAELTGLSTLAAGIAVQAHIYLAHGGVENLRQLHAFLSDTVLMTGFGFAPAGGHADLGRAGAARRRARRRPRRSRCCTTARSSWPATPPTSKRCAGPSKTPADEPLPVYCASLRTAEPELLQRLGDADAMVVTVLAAGGLKPATVSAGGDDDSWNVEHLAALDIPILQGLCLTSSRDQWSRQRRRPEPARRGHPGGGARVRRPHHHGSVLVQGDRRRRADLLRRRPGTLRARRGPGRSGTRGCGMSHPPTSGWRWCSRPIRPSTPASATRSGWTPRPARSRCCGRCASAVTRSAICPASRPTTATP